MKSEMDTNFFLEMVTTTFPSPQPKKWPDVFVVYWYLCEVVDGEIEDRAIAHQLSFSLN